MGSRDKGQYLCGKWRQLFLWETFSSLCFSDTIFFSSLSFLSTPSFLSISWLHLFTPKKKCSQSFVSAPDLSVDLLSFIPTSSRLFNTHTNTHTHDQTHILFLNVSFFSQTWTFYVKILLLWATISKILKLLSSLPYQYYQILLLIWPPSSFNLCHLEETARTTVSVLQHQWYDLALNLSNTMGKPRVCKIPKWLILFHWLNAKEIFDLNTIINEWFNFLFPYYLFHSMIIFAFASRICFLPRKVKPFHIQQSDNIFKITVAG